MGRASDHSVQRRGAHGFTLLELMVVVGVVATVVALATFTLQRSRERAGLERSTMDLRARVERVRALAAVAGSRLGTPRLQLDATCPPGPDGDLTRLWVTLDPDAGTVVFPAQLRADPGADRLDVTCTAWQNFGLGYGRQNAGRFWAPDDPVQFTFSATGRLLTSDGEPDLLVVIENERREFERSGIRILPSGVVCAATDPDVPCEEDPT
jgi:prepilin-type N-terminal cleavage/methylation domain-containing protein